MAAIIRTYSVMVWPLLLSRSFTSIRFRYLIIVSSPPYCVSAACLLRQHCSINSIVCAGLARHRTDGDRADKHRVDIRATGAVDPHRREAFDRNRAAPVASSPVHHRDDSDPRVGEGVVAPGAARVGAYPRGYAAVDSGLS